MQKNRNTRQDERTGFRYAFPGILNKFRDNPLLAPRTETFDSLITSIYTKSRQAEHLIPMFRIPIRLAGAGDFLSPFLPKDYLKWQATGSEIYGSGQTPLEKYKDLIEQAKQGKTLVQQNNMEIGLRNAGMKFQKTGRVFGDIVTKHAGQDITVMSGVYLAETGTFADSSLINLWRSGSRQVNVFPSLSPNTLNKFNDAVKKFAGSGFSDESLSELGRYGGFIRGLASTATTKYVAAMNRFLREPMPFVDSLLAKTTEKELALDPIGKRVLEHFERSGKTAIDLFKQGDTITVQERIPFGKLPPWMRPYVSDAKWTKSSGRMFAGLVGKGLLWATALPAAYSALDFSRRKMDTLPERAVGAPLFAMVGMAAGSLIETAPLRKMPRLTKSQAIGAGIGFAIGALPMFDKGITAGGANLLSRIHLGASKLMDKIDAHTIVERQEDLMPGITSPFTAAGFAFTGGIISIVNNEIGTIGGRIDRHKLRKLIESGVPLSDPRVQALLQRESIGAIATTVELEKILAGEKITPTTRAGFIARDRPLSPLDMSAPFHTDSKTSRYEMAQEIYNRTQDDIKRQAELTHQVRVKDRGVAFRIKEGVKSVWHGPRGFVRGALKGAALFAGMAEVGAIASGVLGGNLNPAGLVPGFLLKMFGAGTRPDELEDIYSGKKEVAVRKGRFWLMGRCLAKSTSCKIGDCGEVKEAQYITENDRLVGADGKSHPIRNIWVRPYKGSILKIYTSLDRNEPVMITPNHVIPYREIIRKKNTEKETWEYSPEIEGIASELRKGMFLRVPLNRSQHKENIRIDLGNIGLSCYFITSKNHIVSAQRNWKTRALQRAGHTEEFPRFLELNEDLAYFLGMFVAERNLSFNKDTPHLIETTHHINEKDKYNRLIRFYNSYGLRATIKTMVGSAIKVRCSHSILANMIFSLIYGNIKGSCKEKKIPKEIFESPNNVKEAFIQGWFDGDGHYDGTSKNISSANYSLILQGQQLLLSLGYHPRIPKVEIRSQYTAPQGTTYGEFRKYRLAWHIDPSYSFRFIEIEKELYTQITSIEEEDYDDLVYDFEIDHDDHLFSCSGILVHNSKFEGEGIERFRHHRLFLAQTDAEDNALYGSVDEKMAYEPIFSPIKAIFDDEFKYHRERRMMYESPTPLSGAMFTDVPIIGDVLASTLGELIKPTVKIRPAEWYVGGGYATQERGFFTETFGGREPPQPGMGSPMMATPADSNSFITTSSRFIKRISEQAGLFGFMTTTAAGMKRSYEPVMERADMMYGLRKKFWSMDLGDPGLCFVKGTQVLMADRTYKNIENVKIGDEVFSADNRKRPRKVVDIVKRSGRRKRLLTIKPYGCDSFTCTANHWIPAVRREDLSQYKDVQAQDLNKNCYLLRPIVLSINTHYHYQIFRQTMAPLPNCVDPDSIVPNILVGKFNEFSLHRIESIKEENYEAEELYDLTIENLHYYVVGQTIVHNTEAVRRFLPPDKTAYYNSLANTAPSWLPTNNWYQDFGRGNYWGKIAEAPIRLPGRGLCVHPETPIATLGGESIKAQDVEVGDMVLTHRGPRMVLRVFRRAHKGTMYKVHTTGTSMTTILTKNHYVKTFHYNKSNHLVYDWIPAYRLSVEDIVCCPTEEALEYRVITDIEKLYFEGSVYDFEIEDVHEYTATFLIHNSTLHPELEGVNPEQYSASWKYKILSDLAYGSQEWKLSKQMVIAQLQGGMLTDEEKSMLSETNRQLEAKRTKRKFEEYRFARDALQKEKVTVTGVLEDGSFTVAEYGNRVFSLGGINMTMAGISREAIRTGNAKTQAEAMRYSKSKKTMMMDTVREHLYNGAELDIYIHGDEITNFESSTSLAYIPELSKKIVSLGAEVEDNAFSRQVKFNGVQRFFGAAWEMVRHNADAPLSPGKAFSQFLPFQTEHKYIVRSSAIEDYARFQVYGPKIQMWEEIVEDFMGTAMNEWRAKIAGDFLPKKIQFRRTFQEYFDRLTWMKYFMLEQGARKEKNEELAEVFAERKRQTISGADPFRGFKDIWRALPRSERDYYRSFIDAESDEDRERILALVPEPVGKIYQAQWLEKEVRAITNKQEAGIASQSDKQRLKRLYELRRVEGQDWSREKEQEYRQEGDPNVSYADWARLQEMKEYFSNFKLPDKNWVAWQPGVSVQDVELKLAQQEGINIHDLDLWESQAQEIEYKPYIKGAVKEVSDWADPGISPQKVNAHIRDMMGMMGRYSRVTTMPGSMEGRKVVMMARDNRFEDVRQVMDGRTEI